MTLSTLPTAINFKQIKKVLITKLRFHGDVLLSSPVFQALKNHYPHISIDGLIYHETRDMLSHHPAVDQIFTIDRGWKKQGFIFQVHKELDLFRQLKRQHYDLIIHLTEDWRGLLLKHSLSIPYAVTADYPRRRKNWLWQKTFNYIYPVPFERHKISSHLDSLQRLGVTLKSEDFKMVLAVAESDQKVVDSLLDQQGLLNTSFIVVHPTSRFFYKCWPPAIMAQLINQLAELKINIVLTAAPSEPEQLYIKLLKENLKYSVVDLSGQLTLKQLAEVIRRGRCFVGVDSAPMHMAVAVDTPLVALFGVTNTSIWGPKGDNIEVLKSSSSLEKPALINGARPNGIENCILDIPCQQVLDSVLRLVAL